MNQIFTHPPYQIVFQTEESIFRHVSAGSAEFSWLNPDHSTDLFAIYCGDQRYTAANMELTQTVEHSRSGARQVVYEFTGDGLRVEFNVIHYPEATLIECWPVVWNTGTQNLVFERIDSLVVALTNETYELFSFTGNWGSEFEPHHRQLDQAVVLESRSGRSSKGNHPWFALTNALGEVFSASVVWSGNWVFRFIPDAQKDRIVLSGGLNDWSFGATLKPGENFAGAPVVVALGKDLDEVAQQHARVGRKFWYPKNEFASTLPVEWNHWWPYEDLEINEEIFCKNVDRAAEMGFEICTLDAGWFGPSDPGTFWEHYRGDWHMVNEKRFPSGIRALSDYVHARGMKFGIWCEIEGLGKSAALAVEHPEYVSERDGQPLGQVCLGNPQAQEWAYQTLKRLITEYQSDWIKVDFNLDSGASCNRSDHGHGAGDGLYAQVRGYYRLSERIRQDFPHVVLENCSSGGLRIDLGTLRHTHMTFLSDPDYPVHDLQVFWGASTMLASDVLLHWTYSDWRNTNPPPEQRFNPHDPALTPAKWDYLARISMLGLFGLSQKLPDLPTWLYESMLENIRVYKTVVRRFVKEADLFRLTTQPRRNGTGDRWTAFQYQIPHSGENLVFVFRLPGAEPERSIRLKALQPQALYRVQNLDGAGDYTLSGAALMEQGIRFTQLAEEESALYQVNLYEAK